MFDQVIDKVKGIGGNIIKGPVATGIGVATLLCQNDAIAALLPSIAAYCGIVAGVSLLLAKFK